VKFSIGRVYVSTKCKRITIDDEVYMVDQRVADVFQGVCQALDEAQKKLQKYDMLKFSTAAGGPPIGIWP
jgi:hypothetical protein